MTVIDHNSGSVPPELLALGEGGHALLANLTATDRALYALALKRFEQATRTAELRLGRPLLRCTNFSNGRVVARRMAHGDKSR